MTLPDTAAGPAGDPPVARRAGPSGRRRALLAGAVLVMLGLIAASAVVGSWLRTPEQAAAEAAPPSPSLITVAAERRVLSEPVVLRGRVLPGDSVKVHPPAAAAGTDSVVTRVVVGEGDPLREGGVLLAVAGRPVFALALPFPLYRDLAGGMTGPDVTEVQRALARIGYELTVTGTLDAATQQALDRWYADQGFAAPPGSAEAQEGLPAARQELRAARAAQDEAVAADTGVAEAKAVLDQAEQHLAELELAAGPGLPRSAVIRVRKATGTVTAVRVRVGDVLDTPEAVLCELDGGDPYVMSVAAPDQVELISASQEARVVDEAGDREAEAEVARVGEEPAVDEATGASGFQVRLRFTGEPMPPSENRTVRVDFSAAVVADPTLAVPLTAVYSRADGSTFVTVMRPDATTVDVSVLTGQVAGGWVAVEPAGDRPLAPGDPVVVGHSGA